MSWSKFISLQSLRQTVYSCSRNVSVVGYTSLLGFTVEMQLWSVLWRDIILCNSKSIFLSTRSSVLTYFWHGASIFCVKWDSCLMLLQGTYETDLPYRFFSYALSIPELSQQYLGIKNQIPSKTLGGHTSQLLWKQNKITDSHFKG